jgi:hypothetical protein
MDSRRSPTIEADDQDHDKHDDCHSPQAKRNHSPPAHDFVAGLAQAVVRSREETIPGRLVAVGKAVELSAPSASPRRHAAALVTRAHWLLRDLSVGQPLESKYGLLGLPATESAAATGE